MDDGGFAGGGGRGVGGEVSAGFGGEGVEVAYDCCEVILKVVVSDNLDEVKRW